MRHKLPPKNRRTLQLLTTYTRSRGACGAWHRDSEYVCSCSSEGCDLPSAYLGIQVVALPKVQWDGGSHCSQEVYITYSGMSATAKIVDEVGPIILFPGSPLTSRD